MMINQLFTGISNINYYTKILKGDTIMFTTKMHNVNRAVEMRYEDVSAFACAFYADACEYNHDSKSLARIGRSTVL